MSDVGPLSAADVVIRSDPAEARRVQEAIELQLKAHLYSEHDIFSIRLALEEALVNAIKHGNRCDRHKKIQIAYKILPERFEILITDEGNGFNPAKVPDPTAAGNIERPCGRGLMLMRYYMSQVSFGPTGNSVLMTKLCNGRAPRRKG